MELLYARIIPPAPLPLTGTKWTLDSFYTAEAVSSVISGTTITAVFDENGNVTGSAGCNSYFAPYNVTGTPMSIGPVGSARMYCTSDGVMQQEMAYLALLGRAATFTITGNRLYLADEKGLTLLSFTKEHWREIQRQFFVRIFAQRSIRWPPGLAITCPDSGKYSKSRTSTDRIHQPHIFKNFWINCMKRGSGRTVMTEVLS